MIDAGRKRARPIVMTTLAMVAGMIPSAMAFGDGGEFRAPMAIAVIGGLLVSTVLSLVFVPSFFTVMDDVGRFVWCIFGRFVGPTDESPEYLAAAAHTRPRRSDRRCPRSKLRAFASRAHARGMSESRGSAGAERCDLISAEAACMVAACSARRAQVLRCRGCDFGVNELQVPSRALGRGLSSSGPRRLRCSYDPRR